MGATTPEPSPDHIDEWNTRYATHEDVWFFGREPSDLARTAGQFWTLLHGDMRGPLLDLGCGEGRDTVHYARMGFEVTAVDGSEAGLRKLDRLAREYNATTIRAVRMDVRDFPLDPAFRFVHCNNCLQFLGAECLPMLSRLQAVMPPGGLHAISVFTREAEALAGRQDLYRFDRNELKLLYREWRLLYYSEDLIWREPSQTYLSFARVVAQKRPQENDS